ncbi:MAG: hypothetical protein ABWY20_13270 [Mycobacterium sp.]
MRLPRRLDQTATRRPRCSFEAHTGDGWSAEAIFPPDQGDSMWAYAAVGSTV